MTCFPLNLTLYSGWPLSSKIDTTICLSGEVTETVLATATLLNAVPSIIEVMVVSLDNERFLAWKFFFCIAALSWYGSNVERNEYMVPSLCLIYCYSFVVQVLLKFCCC